MVDGGEPATPVGSPEPPGVGGSVLGEGAIMVKYAILLSWTEQGVANVKDTVARYQGAKALLESMGGSFEALVWTAGPYDLVAIVNVPDDETAAAFNLTLAQAGNLKTLTMRAFGEDEMQGIIDRMS
jgi:uncharacterized protein with GYD domain